MRGERIVTAGNFALLHEGVRDYILSHPEDEHVFIATADSPESIAAISKRNKRGRPPTAAIVYDYPDPSDTKAVINGLSEAFPGIKIIGVDIDPEIGGVSHRLTFPYKPEDLRALLLKI